jgi:GT2 family glycosyltransferase/glycosyltransferase involved in cell wall biosynthesis
MHDGPAPDPSSGVELPLHEVPVGLLVAVPLYRSPELILPLTDALLAMAGELERLNATVVLINDSPDDEGLAVALDTARERLGGALALEIVTNDQNMGFIASVNRAFDMALARDWDVVLLNSDALPRPGAFAEMLEVAYIDPRIAVVSPRSDNATICNSPIADMVRAGGSEAAYNAHKRIEPHLPRFTYVPTAVGFCLLIKRQALSELGLFDPVYGAGYNEENDFIRRCGRHGYRAALANRAYVHHIGEVSFSKSDVARAEREKENRAILIDRYPEYDDAVARYLDSAEHRAEALLGGLAPIDGRIGVLIDCRMASRTVDEFIKGVRPLLGAFGRRLSDRFDLRVLYDHDPLLRQLYEIPGLRPWTRDEPWRPFAIVLRVGVPDAAALASLPALGAITGALMVETGTPCDDADERDLATLAARVLDLIGFDSAAAGERFGQGHALPARTIRFVVPDDAGADWDAVADSLADTFEKAIRQFDFATCCRRQEAFVASMRRDDVEAGPTAVERLADEMELKVVAEARAEAASQAVARLEEQIRELAERLAAMPLASPKTDIEEEPLAAAVPEAIETARTGTGEAMGLSASRIFGFGFGRRRRRQQQELASLRALVETPQNKADGIFDRDWYLAAYPDVRAKGFDPVYHYFRHGAAESRNPGPGFETAFYLRTFPEVAAAGDNPLLHYIKTGREAGLAPNSRVYQPPRLDARYEVVKDFALGSAREAAVLVAHAPLGRLKPHVLPYADLLSANGIAVLLVVVADRPVDFLGAELAAPAGIVVRENLGYDFAAWAQGIRLFPEIWSADALYVTNDSVVPSANGARFDALVDRVRASEADIVGLTASHEYGWHVQSYFLAVKATALSSWAFQLFVRDIQLLGSKDEVIQAYEVPFAARMQAAGLSVEILFESPFAVNPTLFGWRELIGQGFPFVKLLLLRGQFPQVDTAGWDTFLTHAGFDVATIRASILASEATAPVGSFTGRLLAQPHRFAGVTPNRPLNVAYIGPWNYDNGLGQAARELLGALRRTGHRLNVHPIERPFHVHRLVSPAVATTDFVGRPDVAIVHLNPDSWHLLTPEQRDGVRSARRRIGYWVWETDTIPPAWQADLLSVERVWAPTRYCAEIFADAVGVPVDVVPHPVSVPESGRADRATILNKLGVDPAWRVILYVFDGASYLVRKNPGALIRAFAASGLQGRGWSLLLKTKNLFDVPEAGAELTALARATPGVVLVDATLDADELSGLLEAADIYASPHCSEGFGLTIAEAMALGKPVVATDFSGSRDFLDQSCGYPVKADAVTLTKDHGHYLAGHGWAQIDESALAEALLRAAAGVETGKTEIGDAARDAVAAKLSYDAVADAISASLRAAMADGDIEKRTAPTAPPTPPLPAIDLSDAAYFRTARPSEGIVPVCLGSDLAWHGQLPEAGKDDWYLFAPSDAKIAPNAFNAVRAAINLRPDVKLFYADDVSPAADPLDRVRLKPDFDATLIAAQDYIGAPVAARATLVRELGGLEPAKGSAALYDLVLRAAEKGAVARIPHVLIGHDRARTAVSGAQRRAVLQTIRRYASYTIEDGEGDRTRLVRRFDADFAPVTIVVPTRRTNLPGGGGTYVERLLAAIAQTDWPMDRLTVLIGDDLPDVPGWATKTWPFALQRIPTPRAEGEPFNYAAKMNRLWRAACDEQIVLMNDDVAPHGPGWLKALQGFALDKSVGGVGARLLYENGTIQHAGIFPSLRTVVHAWAGMAADAKTYQDWANVQREWSMVTGAVFATRRSVMDRIGGFDERFSLEFNDIDLCLRLRALGYRIVYNPDATFTHAEKASRGEAPPPAEDVALFLTRWSAWLEHDPSSHPGYSTDHMVIAPSIDREAWYAA